MTAPIFAEVFGAQWDGLPAALKAHYANRPYSNDVVTHHGALDISLSPMMRRFKWLLRLSRVLVPFEGTGIPCTVYTRSDPRSKTYIFERHFFPPGEAEYVFRSELVCLKPHVVVEYFAFGGGWKATYWYEGDKVILRHAGFCWRVFGWHVPLPGWLDVFFGVGGAFEQATGEDRFCMATELNHFLHDGPMVGYRGEFTVTEVRLEP